ncbi:DUF6864 domain-containing function [Cupriavidus pinatubonensis]|uniref:DUF6864 domain-containing function n=1 Tax=Cupriavidus pinatubonensis TaxID=248026 RepID=UPI003593600C
MKIFVGNLEVYASGTIHSPDLSDARFIVSTEPQFNIIFRVVFQTEETGISLQLLDENSIAIVFSKPSSLGFASARPIKVGRLEGRELFVTFSVNMRGNNDSYSLDYTFYLGENA